jgi:hypothetical protein
VRMWIEATKTCIRKRWTGTLQEQGTTNNERWLVNTVYEYTRENTRDTTRHERRRTRYENSNSNEHNPGGRTERIEAHLGRADSGWSLTIRLICSSTAIEGY